MQEQETASALALFDAFAAAQIAGESGFETINRVSAIVRTRLHILLVGLPVGARQAFVGRGARLFPAFVFGSAFRAFIPGLCGAAGIEQYGENTCGKDGKFHGWIGFRNRAVWLRDLTLEMLL